MIPSSRDPRFQATYTSSAALIIGINEYMAAAKLRFAKDDALAVQDALVGGHGFEADRVTTLIDGDATKSAILRALNSFTLDGIEPDTRLLMYFAGHGYTVVGRRGEVGFLVPMDGDPDDLSTLIRWDEIVKTTELIAAKHVFLVVDACYGGLVLTRRWEAGSMRFLKDMLLRYTRQALTAGKADELVSDGGGPRPGHSVFTGHFLDALAGEATTPDGILAATGIMNYVYRRVAEDYDSHQTPHFGHLDGDGDFIFQFGDALKESDAREEIDADVLIGVAMPQEEPQDTPKPQDQVKELLSDLRFKIGLDDFFSERLRVIREELAEERFPLNTQTVTVEEIVVRIQEYESVVESLLGPVTLLGRWGQPPHRPTIERIPNHLTDFDHITGGTVVWIGLRWYPALLTMYSCGIGALAGRAYANLASLMLTPVGARQSNQETPSAVKAIVDGISDAERAEPFKRIPGHERHFVPRSEYLFKVVQPFVDEALFVGNRYEELFDEFEILLALAYADFRIRDESGRLWAPAGRFGWKRAHSVGENDPYARIGRDAERLRDEWAPLQAGFFSGSYDRFKDLHERFGELLSKMRSW